MSTHDKLPALLHHPHLLLEGFQNWGLDFVRPFTPTITLDLTFYNIKWVEIGVLHDNTTSTTLYVRIPRAAMPFPIELVKSHRGHFIN